MAPSILESPTMKLNNFYRNFCGWKCRILGWFGAFAFSKRRFVPKCTDRFVIKPLKIYS